MKPNIWAIMDFNGVQIICSALNSSYLISIKYSFWSVYLSLLKLMFPVPV